MNSARPTAASAAATARTKKTRIWPVRWSSCREYATSARLAALSITSMERKMLMPLRRVSAPTVPMPNSATDSSRYQPTGTPTVSLTSWTPLTAAPPAWRCLRLRRRPPPPPPGGAIPPAPPPAPPPPAKLPPPGNEAGRAPPPARSSSAAQLGVVASAASTSSTALFEPVEPAPPAPAPPASRSMGAGGPRPPRPAPPRQLVRRRAAGDHGGADHRHQQQQADDLERQ